MFWVYVLCNSLSGECITYCMYGLKLQVWLTPTHVNELMYFMTYVCLDANSIIVLKLYITDHYNKDACSHWLLLHSKKLQGVSFLIRYKTINVAGKNSQNISGPWIEASTRQHIALSNSNHETKELDIGGLFFYHVPSDEKISNSSGLLKFQHCWKNGWRILSSLNRFFFCASIHLMAHQCFLKRAPKASWISFTLGVSRVWAYFCSLSLSCWRLSPCCLK